jgi:enoyl-[acyl-carrier protein] reductase II
MYRAFAAAQQFNIPLWKVLPGLITQWDKLYAVAQFGAATQLLEKATVDGDLNQGVQFVGQSLGVIDSVQTVDEIVQQVLAEAKQASSKAYKYFG